MASHTPISAPRQRGLSLVELMVGLALGLLLVAGMTTLFVNNSRTRGEIEKDSRQIENGRYAMQLLSENLRLAGYLAEFDPSVLDSPTAKPDACITGSTAAELVTLRTAGLPLHVQGYDDEAVGARPACISDRRAGTDILVIRRVATCEVGAAGCDEAVAGRVYFQTSLCNPATGSPLAGKELAGPVSGRYVLDTATAAFTLHKRDCKDPNFAARRQFLTQIYFVANNNRDGDGIPTLKRAELGAGSFSIVPLVEGIENLQLEYGFEDGGSQVFNANPDSYKGCSEADCISKYWRRTTAVKVHLLARNTQPTGGYVDEKTYTLGNKANGLPNVVGPVGDAYRRHSYTVTVRLNNPAQRQL